MTDRAVVLGGAVVNIVSLPDGWGGSNKKDWKPPEGALVVELSTGCEIGGDYDYETRKFTPVPKIHPSSNETIAGVKQEAARRILLIAPEYKQRNMTARGVELLQNRVINGHWTADETVEVGLLSKVWEVIKSVRTQSDYLETLIAGLSDEERLTFNVRDDENWILK